MKQSWRMLVRDWRAGELRILAAALVVAVASVTSVGFFADRVGQALVRDAHQLLGADLVLAADHPWSGEVTAEIARRGLERAAAVNFMSMIGAGEQSTIAGVKAVTPNYPLRGRLRTAPSPGAPDGPAAHGPERGTVWLDERLVASLGAPVGSRVRVGRAELAVGAVLTLEPERSANFFNIAPRLMMHADDVAATGLVQTGSRVNYYLYAAGPAAQVQQFQDFIKPRLARGERVDDLESGRPELRATIERARNYLGLTALLAAVLAGVAIALCTRRFVERHLDGCAVMRCLGATQAKLVSLYGLEFTLLGVGACAAGCLVGFGAQAAIASVLGGLLRAELPAPTALPALQGFLVGLVLLLGFALPPLVQLKNVPAVRVIRRETGTTMGAAVTYLIGSILLAALLIWQSGDARLGGYVVGGFAAAVLVFFAASWGALRLLTVPSFIRIFPASVRYGLANLRRHLRGNAVQVASLALGLTAVLQLTFTRNDLVDAWRRSAPADAPSHFLIGVQPDQREPVRQFFAERGVTLPELYPMVRGRLTAVNGAPVSEASFEDERAKRLVEREFNLSYMEQLPSHNVVTAGRWLDAGKDELSVEEGIAKRLGWALGDELTWMVGGESFKARITSLRKLRWDSMKVNFFVITPPRTLANRPASFISAFRLPSGREDMVNGLAARFPNLTVVDVGAAVRQLQAVVGQLITAVQFIFLFALAAGLLVLYSALVATEDERRREAAVMRVYGASRAQVAGSQRAEFLAMGALAGVLGTLGAALIGQVVATRVFDIDLPPSLALLVTGPLAGLALLSLNAWLSSRKVLRASPALTLRDSV